MYVGNFEQNTNERVNVLYAVQSRLRSRRREWGGGGSERKKTSITTIGYDFHNKSNALSVFTSITVAMREIKPMGIVLQCHTANNHKL